MTDGISQYIKVNNGIVRCLLMTVFTVLYPINNAQMDQMGRTIWTAS